MSFVTSLKNGFKSRSSLFGMGALLLSAVANPAHAQWAWDGVSKKDTDDIVTLELPKEPSEVLLNGDRATIYKDAPSGTVKVLIASDASGISCENIYTVKFKDEKAGQLIANHCHGDTYFKVRPGEITDARLTKGDVDDPEDDDVPGNSIAFEWSANGFTEIDSALKWFGVGGRDANMSFAIPETDAFFWITECKNGEAWNYIQMGRLDEPIGGQDFLKFETDNSKLTGYYADIAALPFGDGGPNDPTILLKLEPENDLFADMAKGSWLYIQRGDGDDAIKHRLSLRGSGAAIRNFQSGCKGRGHNNVGSSFKVPPLSAYNGKYPFNEVGGLTILQHPLYKDGVGRVVSNPEDRTWLLSDRVTAGPIEYKNGKAIISGCEPHNCGNRNWTAIVDAMSGETEVCFEKARGIVSQTIRYSRYGITKMRINETCER